jgi:hypothetical protein
MSLAIWQAERHPQHTGFGHLTRQSLLANPWNGFREQAQRRFRRKLQASIGIQLLVDRISILRQQ